MLIKFPNMAPATLDALPLIIYVSLIIILDFEINKCPPCRIAEPFSNLDFIKVIYQNNYSIFIHRNPPNK